MNTEQIEKINSKINLCALSTQKLIFAYLHKSKIEYYKNDDNFIIFNMSKLNKFQIIEINKIIQNNKTKIKKQKNKIFHCDNSLIVYGDD